MSRARRYIANMTPAGSMTAEEFVRLQPPDKRSELVNGQLIVREPAGFRHGRIAARLAHRLSERVEANDLGVVCAAETGFVLQREPDTVRGPDVAFISRERLPDPEPVAFAELAPDLAVEVPIPRRSARRGTVQGGGLAERRKPHGLGRGSGPPTGPRLSPGR